MGHSEKMNQDFYQAPLALLEITRVGKQLMKIDAGQSADIQDQPLIDNSKSAIKESDGTVVKESQSHTLSLKDLHLDDISDFHSNKKNVCDFNNGGDIMFDNLTLKNEGSSHNAGKKILSKTIETNIGANFTKVFDGLNLKVYPKRSHKKINYQNTEANEEKLEEHESDYINESQDEDSENIGSDEKREDLKSNPTRWTANQVEALNCYFGDFICGKISDWPTRKEIEAFRIKNAVPFPYSKIRSKLVNDREKKEDRKASEPNFRINDAKTRICKTVALCNESIFQIIFFLVNWFLFKSTSLDNIVFQLVKFWLKKSYNL